MFVYMNICKDSSRYLKGKKIENLKFFRILFENMDSEKIETHSTRRALVRIIPILIEAF